MMVLGQVGEEHVGFDVKVDGSQGVIEASFDGDDGSFVWKYLPISFFHRFSDVGGNLLFVGTDQQDDGRIAFGEGVGPFLVTGVVAGEDKPAMAEVAVASTDAD